MFKRDRFDLVITDYLMPEMRGDEMAANLKRLAPSQPILMLTGSAEALDTSKLLINGLLRKPFSIGRCAKPLAGSADRAATAEAWSVAEGRRECVGNR